MEIYQIKHFIAIVETGSFTKGADRAAVTQSTISISIAKLEAEFGVQLLERRSPVVPTGGGERLIEVDKAISAVQCVERRTLNDRQTEASADWNTAIPLQSPRFQAARFFSARQSPCGYRNVRWSW
jgi:DNA-binding transcriptional LysR family regulator